MCASAFTWIVLSCTCLAAVYGQYLNSSPTIISSKSTGYLPPPPSDITAEGDTPLGTGVLLKTNEEEEDGKYHHEEDHTHWDIRKSVPGEPNKDYPVYDSIPSTSFTCQGKSEGYFADIEARCQVFHICTSMPVVKKSFLCPNGSIFNQELSICDWWTQVDCRESEQFYERNDSDKTDQNQVEIQKPLKFIPSDIDIRFGVSESTKLNIDLLPPHSMVNTKRPISVNSASNYKSNIAQTAQMIFTTKSDEQIIPSFSPLDNKVHDAFNSRINQKYPQQEIAPTFNKISSHYLGSSTTPTYSTAESKTNHRGSTLSHTFKQLFSSQNDQQDSEVKDNTNIHSENEKENSYVKQNIYLPPENIQENTNVKPNIYLPPENIQSNSEVKQNIYLQPENIQQNSNVKPNIYLPPENIQSNSDVKQNIYLPPEKIQENSDVKQNIYLPPENVQANSDVQRNTYLSPENIPENSDVKQNLSPGSIQSTSEDSIKSERQQSLNTLPKNDPQVSIKLLKQFSSTYSNQQEDGHLIKNSDDTFSPSSFPSTLSHLLLGGTSVNPTDQTVQQLFSVGPKTDFQSSSEISSNKVIINNPTFTSEVSSTKSHFTPPSSSTEKYRLINIYPVKKDDIDNTPYYKSTLIVPTTQTAQFTDNSISYVTPSTMTVVGTTQSPSTAQSYSTTINLINDLATPSEQKLTPKLTFSDNADQKKELKISLVREYSGDKTQHSEDTNLHYDHSLTSTLTSTENTPNNQKNSGLRFSLLKGFSTPRPFDNNENIGSSYLPPNLQASSVNSINNFVTENVDLKPFDILNINNLQPSTTPSIERRNDGPELVQSISFNLDSEAGRKEFDLAVSSGFFSNS